MAKITYNEDGSIITIIGDFEKMFVKQDTSYGAHLMYRVTNTFDHDFGLFHNKTEAIAEAVRWADTDPEQCDDGLNDFEDMDFESAPLY